MIGVGDLQRRQEAKARVIDQAVEVPVGPELVARLVITFGFECQDLFFAPIGRAANEIGPGLEVQSRYANLGEVELVGALESAPVRKLIRFDPAAEAGSDLTQ